MNNEEENQSSDENETSEENENENIVENVHDNQNQSIEDKLLGCRNRFHLFLEEIGDYKHHSFNIEDIKKEFKIKI